MTEQLIHGWESLGPGSTEIVLDAGSYRFDAAIVGDGQVERLTQLGEEIAAAAHVRDTQLTDELGLAGRPALSERLGLTTRGTPQVVGADGSVLAAASGTFELKEPATVTVSFGDAPCVIQIFQE